ncbi:MAG TPA: hypothetical protein VFB79_23250 [Candidatus Angelobacter sp.]|nr:hypothetical protein [Candidatus Angelobacter sp.]
MNCIVDAGAILFVLGVSPRDCALSAVADLNGHVRFPIDVFVPDTGEVFRFIEREPEPNPIEEEKKPNGRETLPQKDIKPAAR